MSRLYTNRHSALYPFLLDLLQNFILPSLRRRRHKLSCPQIHHSQCSRQNTISIIYRSPDHVVTRRYSWIPAYLGPLERWSGRVPKYLNLQPNAPLDADIPQNGFLAIR